MTGQDVVIVLPGIMGSTLARDGRPVWAASAGSIIRAITTFTRSIRDLELPPDIGEEAADDGVTPVGLMPDLHALPGIWTPVKGYDRLLDRLRRLGYEESAGNLVPFPYDWRLSNRHTAALLRATAESALERWRAQHPDAQLILVGHSMGGLIARWYVEKLGGAEVTRKVITLGTPYRGAARALEQLVNGVQPGIGPLSVDLTTFARSLPSLHQLLPEYACLEHNGDLVRTTDVPLPELATAAVADAMRFHTDLRTAETARPASLTSTHAIVGIGQPTPTTAQLDRGRIATLETYQGEDLNGDSTVPAVAGCRSDVPMDSPLLRRVPDKHGNLQRNRAALDELEGILTASDVVVRGRDGVQVYLAAPDLVLAGQEISIRSRLDGRHAAVVLLRDEAGRTVSSRAITGKETTTFFDGVPPGGYTIDVTGTAPGSPIAPLSAPLLAWDPTIR